MDNCLKGNHKECQGSIRPSEGYIGGTICNCPCHKSDILHPGRLLMNTPDHLHALQAEILGIESQTATNKGLWAVILGLKPFIDDDQWCILYGENIQEGIVGFGETPIEAMYDFDKAMYGRVIKKE
jgi:hypothetical protein